MDKQALKPDVFRIPSFQKKEVDKDIKVLTQEEKILGAGATTQFWKTLKEHIENIVIELDQVNTDAIGSGASFEEIGRNTVVINLVKGVIERIFEVVDDASKSLEANGE